MHWLQMCRLSHSVRGPDTKPFFLIPPWFVLCHWPPLPQSAFWHGRELIYKLLSLDYLSSWRASYKSEQVFSLLPMNGRSAVRLPTVSLHGHALKEEPHAGSTKHLSYFEVFLWKLDVFSAYRRVLKLILKANRTNTWVSQSTFPFSLRLLAQD